MKILVTGGAGYIGSILVPLLLQKGHAVNVIDNFMYGQTSLLECCYHPSLEIIRGDVRNENLLQDQLRTVDAILPMACPAEGLCRQLFSNCKHVCHLASRHSLQHILLMMCSVL